MAPLKPRQADIVQSRKPKRPKSIPKFRNEAEERRFWETHDSTDYVDWSKAKRIRLPNLKPSTTAISLRLPVALLEQIKVAANKREDLACGEDRRARVLTLRRTTYRRP
jgi:hypothetical protein